MRSLLLITIAAGLAQGGDPSLFKHRRHAARVSQLEATDRRIEAAVNDAKMACQDYQPCFRKSYKQYDANRVKLENEWRAETRLHVHYLSQYPAQVSKRDT